jgi:hypothetical protein
MDIITKIILHIDWQYNKPGPEDLVFYTFNKDNVFEFDILVLDHEIFESEKHRKKWFDRVVTDKMKKLVKKKQKEGNLTDIDIYKIENWIKTWNCPLSYDYDASHLLKDLEEEFENVDFVCINSYTGFDYDIKSNVKCLACFFDV